MSIGMAARLAGPKLLSFLRGGMTNPELARRLAPDLAFATINAAMTPGTLADKGISGGTDFLMSSLSGLAAGNVARKMGASPRSSELVDMIASVAGGYGSLPVSDQITRTIDSVTGGPGLTGYEKLSKKDQELYADQIRQNTLASLGLLPGINPQYVGNDYLAQLGLAG